MSVHQCACGCGQPAPLADKTDRRRGIVMGRQRDFIPGHAARRDPRARFWSQVNKHSGHWWNGTECWEWAGGASDTGYGTFWLEGRTVRAHRYAFTQLNGPIPAGLEPDHLCRNRICVRQSHLELVTGRVNVLRSESVTAINARKTMCLRGHPFTPWNTAIRSRANGTTYRACLTCRRAANRAAQERRRAGARAPHRGEGTAP
jgi:hypothetical protein